MSSPNSSEEYYDTYGWSGSFVDKGLISNCCGAPVYGDTDICSSCLEHCSVETNDKQNS